MKYNNVVELYKEKVFLEDGENALHLAEIIRRYGKDGWTKRKIAIALEMIDPNLKELSEITNFDPSKTEEISKKTGIPISKLSVMSMIIEPQKYLPMDETMVKLSVNQSIDVSNYSAFLSGWRKVLLQNTGYFDDFIDLYLVLSEKRAYEKDSSIVDETIKMVEKIDFLSLDMKTFGTFKEIYNSLLPSDKKKIADSIKDPYVKGALTRHAGSLLIVDGSNVAMVGLTYADLKNIFLAFRLIGNLKEVPWPFKIIFDQNFEYNLRGTQKKLFEEKFQKHPDVKFHSPADEMILEIARSTNAWILSNDRYHDYPRVDCVMLRFDGKSIFKDKYSHH